MHTSFSADGGAVNPFARCNLAFTERRTPHPCQGPTPHPGPYTLGVMHPNPAPGTGKAAGGDGDGSERYGPLEVRRLKKDDGGALHVYARATPGEGQAPASAP